MPWSVSAPPTPLNTCGPTHIMAHVKRKSVGRMCSANPHMAPLILRRHPQTLPAERVAWLGAAARSRRTPQPSSAQDAQSDTCRCARVPRRSSCPQGLRGCLQLPLALEKPPGHAAPVGRDMRRRGTKTPSGSLPGRRQGCASGLEGGRAARRSRRRRGRGEARLGEFFQPRELNFTSGCAAISRSI